MDSHEDSVVPISPISAPARSQPISPRPDTDPVTPPARRNSSFKDAFLEDFAVVRLRLTKSKCLLEHFISICRLRISQESSSADQAEKYLLKADWSKTLAAAESSIANSVDLFRVNVSKRAQQSRQFIDDVDNEVIKPSERTRDDHDKLYESLERDGLVLTKLLQSEYKNHDECLIRFDKCRRVAESRLAGSGAPSLSPSEHVETGVACLEATSAERAYHAAVVRVNAVRVEYIETMDLILSQLEDLEKSRLELIKDGLEKVYIFEFALHRGAQYEMETAFKEIEQLNSKISDDIPNFIASKSGAVGTSNLRDKGPVKIVSLADIRPSSPTVGETDHAEVQSVEMKIIDAIWGHPDDEISKDVLEAVEEPFMSQLGRISFCRAISDQPSEMPSDTALRNLGKILCLALNLAEAEMDSDTGRRIAAFSLKFFHVGSGNSRKRYIQSEVYHHSLWNRIQFWEEALMLVIADDFIDKFNQGAFASGGGVSVDRFGNYLLIFGINVNSAIEIVKRVVNRDFASLDAGVRDELLGRLMTSIKSAHQRQERNVAMLAGYSPPSSPPLPSPIATAATQNVTL